MATKMFKETDSWGDSGGNNVDVSWSFKKNSKTQDKKNKQSKKRNHSVIEDDPDAGKFVRAPKFYGLEDANEAQQESLDVKKKNKRKRKHETAEENSNQQSSDGVTPEKKLKKVTIDPVTDSHTTPSSFGDKLRESLKGSRFRFLNEQMYKQSGQNSLQDFKDDETAFEAYHEGYRHQVTQWPMNPLDRIIKNIKRL